MSIPPRLAVKLDETLGREATEDVVTLFDDLRDEQRAMRADIAELRQELRASELRLEQRLEQRLTATFRTELAPIHQQLQEITKGLHAVDKRIDEKHALLIAWSAGFWVAAVGAIAALAKVFRG